jgi:class 3 adenylate cyclase/tetratricopeptide (TPR) repeat protein
MRPCPDCGRANTGDANFCAGCGVTLRVQDRRQERKTVSVVFCDLVGFTGRAESMDPEDVRALLDPYHSRLRSELERFGGTVEKFIGDAVVAVFGAPAAHEDDPERAIRAALAIRDWAREADEIEVRVGVNAGEALVSIGPDVASTGIVTGDVINTASRMQSGAPVNGILVGERAYRMTRDRIDYVAHEPLVAKGKSEPVVVWEAVAARSRLGPGVEQRPVTSFVGRDRELALLRDAYAQSRDACEPSLVTVVGVPGAGKSRIVLELSRALDAETDLVTWRQGRCLSYGDGVNFWALAEIVKAETGILDSDSVRTAREKLSASVTALLPVDEAEWVERRLAPLVGLGEEESTSTLREEAFPAWRRFLEAIAERGPTVIVVEDLHWADDGLLDFLDELAEWSTGLPLLLIATARPDLLTRRASWGAGKTSAVTLSLPPLSTAETDRLVKGLLEGAELSREVRHVLLERAGGNPLYAEEFARMIAERGSGHDLVGAMPETVQGIIAARLDGLVPAEKRLMQDAAVVGTTFWTGAVAALSGTAAADLQVALRELERREFVRRERRSSVEGESEYAFRHVLVRDVAYGEIPRAERSERHQRAAVWLAGLGGGDAYAELLAHHYRQAIDYALASGLGIAALAGPARAALTEAGDRALRLGSYSQAQSYFRAAIDLVEDEGGVQYAELLYRYGAAQAWCDGSGEETLAEAVLRLGAVGNSETAARAALILAREAWWRGDRAAVDSRLAEVDELIGDLPDSVVHIESLVSRSSYFMLFGEFDRAIAAATAALEQLEQLEQLDRPDLHARALDVLGCSLCSSGELQRGVPLQRQAIEIARKGRALWELHHGINNLLSTYSSWGHLAEMRVLLDEWEETFDRIGGAAYSRVWYVMTRAELSFHAGQWDAALDGVAQYFAMLAPGRPHYLEPTANGIRALVALSDDRVSEALQLAEGTTRFAQDSGDPQVVAPSLCLYAVCLLADGQRESARAHFDTLLNFGVVLTDKLDFMVCDFAWLAVDLGAARDARAAMDDGKFPRWRAVGTAILDGDALRAADLLDNIGLVPSAAYARLRAGGQHVHQALEFYRSVGATRYIRACEEAITADK